jgi:DNA-directed RNA polymerase subunit RPC12/RpoP
MVLNLRDGAGKCQKLYKCMQCGTFFKEFGDKDGLYGNIACCPNCGRTQKHTTFRVFIDGDWERIR